MSFFEKRLSFVKNFIEERGLSAFLFSSPASVFYLSGFKSSQAYVLITLEKNYFITDGRYYEKAERELKNLWEVFLIRGNTLNFLKTLFRELKIKKLGFEKDHLTCEIREKLKTKGIKFLGLSQVLKDLRKRKLPEEREILKEGIKKTDQVYLKVLEFIKPGISELELRAKVIEEIFKIGALGESFPTIVAGGPNSSIPHWQSSEKLISSSAPLLIDLGLLWKNYCTDFTRTLYLGKPEQEFLKIYEIVRSSWFKAFEKVKTGIPVGKIDQSVREYFNQKGVLNHFIHATGHGIGIEVHEPPRIYYQEKEIIEEGMVFTIEPGLYFPNKFGIRLENLVFVEEGRGKVYSEVSLELKIL
ncbi:MAG: Xaa-Pro peptidase family protein [Thermodesulfobacterium sp.]|nr:Xaa-Pro peptidase family protein [Thermodesulfobacterium sp.]